MGLVELIKERVQGKVPVDPDRLRRARPIRNEFVTSTPQDDGTTLLEAPLELQGKAVTSVLAKWMKAPTTKRFELEGVGSYVWDLCDGKTTFDTISRRLRERYSMSRLESDAALTAFLQMLSQRRLITLMVAKKK